MADLKQRLGVTFIVATHNLNLLSVATRSFELADGHLNPTPAG
jgi:ABC-type lipoprotein export system ATPase subunit